MVTDDVEALPVPEIAADPTSATPESAPATPVDHQPPRLHVTARFVGSALAVHVISDESLGATPVVRVDDLLLSDIVVLSDTSFSALLDMDWIPGSQGVIVVEAEAADLAGNGSSSRSSISAARIGVLGGRLVSEDGLVQLHVPAAREPVSVLIREETGDGGGYWIEFDSSRVYSAELEFRVPPQAGKPTAAPGPFGVLRQAADGRWQPVPSLMAKGIVMANISESGLYKLGESSVIDPEGVLELVYPNPFNSRTVLRFVIGDAGPVSVTVFDGRGAVVRRLVDGFRGSGAWTVGWDGTADSGQAVASGIYFARISSVEMDQVRKMTLAR